MEDHKNTSTNNRNNNSGSTRVVGLEDQYVVEEEEGAVVLFGDHQVPVHSQVMKIKQEYQKISHPSLDEQLEIGTRGVLRRIYRQRSRSPLGLARDQTRPISVGVGLARDQTRPIPVGN